MSVNLNEWFATLDDAGVEHELTDLRREAAKLALEIEHREQVLAMKLRWLESTQNAGGLEPVNGNGHSTNGNGNGNGHAGKRAGQKRAAIVTIMADRPGRWTPAELRDALAARGIDPNAGTEVKNILWHLARDGRVIAHGGGVYEFPAPNGEGAEHVVAERRL